MSSSSNFPVAGKGRDDMATRECVNEKFSYTDIHENGTSVRNQNYRLAKAAFIISSTSCAGFVNKCLYKSKISLSRSSPEGLHMRAATSESLLQVTART